MIGAFLFGTLAAASLPLGALVGGWLRPSDRLIAAIMAFGAGALLAAMSFELVLPAMDRGHFLVLGVGLMLGCLGFVGLNYVLNGKGAFLRKAATLASYAQGVKRRKVAEALDELSHLDVFRSLPPEEVQALVPYLEHRRVGPGEIIVRQGEAGDMLYIVESGEVVVLREEQGRTTPLARLGSGQAFGEMALLTEDVRSASVVSDDAVGLWCVRKADLDRVLETAPRLKAEMSELTRERRLRIRSLMRAEEWKARALGTLPPESVQPDAHDIHEVVRQARMRGAAGFAIWLGAALDNVGEAVVIGATTVGATVSLPLVGGIFMANLPESMSSAATLRQQGVSRPFILGLWLSLVVLAAACAALGHVLLAGARPVSFSFFEAVAAGTILAMIAQTMLPEAFRHGGGPAAAITTVIGFLAGILLQAVAG